MSSSSKYTSTLEVYRPHQQYAEANDFKFIAACCLEFMGYVCRELKYPYQTLVNQYPIILDPVRIYFSIDSEGKLQQTDPQTSSSMFVEIQSISGKHYFDGYTYEKRTQFMIVYALDYQVIYDFVDSIRKKYRIVKEIDYSGKLYEWSTHYQCYVDSDEKCIRVSRSDLKGIDGYFDDIIHDITILTTKTELLEKMGIGSGFNYLLYGNPGTGKSSFVKVISYECKIPVYTVNLNIIKSEYIIKALTPQITNKQDRFCIVLVEDFDRYLDSEIGKSKVSELLNSLDGMFPGRYIIRFFSANNPEKINNEALITRMKRLLFFPNPTQNVIFDHIKNIMPTIEDSCINDFIHALEREQLAGISIRTINLFISRFILEDNPILKATNKVNEWAAELKRINLITSLKPLTADVAGNYYDSQDDNDN